VSGTTTLNNAVTLSSPLNVSGTINANGNKLNFPIILDKYKINLWGQMNMDLE
jgi:hypothetical protein